MRTPETTKAFEETIIFDSGQPAKDWMDQVEAGLVRQRAKAADEARDLLLKQGYFNGEITTFVIDNDGSVTLRATLMGWGLHQVLEPGTCEDCSGFGSPPGEAAGLVCGSCNGTGIESDEEID